MKSFEIKITGNAKSLVDSIKSSQSAMDALIKGIDKADKKLEVLTQTGSHLSNIDKQLAKLKTDYPDIFEKIFPNIDSQINESMKPILQMPELVEQIMTKVEQKMKAIDSGTLKATDDDIKELGNDMRILGETLHLENLDMSFLDGTAKAETKIKRLIDVMVRLVEAYYNVNRAAANVDVENVAQKKNGSKKSKGNIKTSPVDDETSTKKELSEIDKYQQILKVINGEDIKLKTTKKDDLEQLKLLVTQFDEATNAIKRFEAARDTNSDKYKEALAEQYRLAVLLKNTMDDVADNGSERAVNFISSQTGKFGAYSQAEELIKTGFGPNLTKDIGEIFTKKIEKASFSYERLTESVERFHEIFQKVNNDDNLTDEETNALYEEAEKIKNTFSSLDIRTKDFFENLSLGVINTKEVIQELIKMFGIELPAAMDKPEEKIQKLLPTSEGLEKLRIIPDGDQKARISEYAEEYRVILKLLEKGNIKSKETVQALRERARTLKNIIKDVNPGDTTLDKLLTDGYGISKGTADIVSSPKLSSKFKIDEFKSENISNDARQEAIDLIHQEIVAENQLLQKKKEEKELKESAVDVKDAVLSYDKLTKAVERYYELQSKLDSVSDDEADKIADGFTEMNNASSSVFDAIQDGLGKDEALKQLADIFGIKIPEATKKAESGIKDVTSALYETSDGLAKIMYHRGNLLSSKSGTRDNFGQMPGNLTKSVEDDETWKSLGFGIFGGGLFGVANPSMINGPLSKLSGSTFIQSIDLSKYNMYMADTEERAANLAKFMSQLQKFAIKREVPDFTGFDTELSGVSEESLYKQFQGVFDATDMTKEKFLAFISEMRVLLQEAGIEFDKGLNELTFKNKDSSILSSDNISTRLLKQLGYQGVYTGETSYGGFGQGSVLFDFDVTDIIGYFNTVEQATQDFQNSLKNGWTGSNEQLQQYLSNIEEISARIEATKTKQLSFNPDFDVSAYDNTLNALNSVKENIQKVLSGESIITDSGKISSEFKTITSSAQEFTSAVEGTSAAIGNTGAIGSSIEGLNDGVEKAKRALEEFRLLQDEILGKSAAAEGGSMDGEAIGRYTERVEAAKAKLDELAKQSLLTADQIKDANDIYETAIGNLEGKSRTNNEYIEDLEGREQVGSYDSGYDRGYYDARSEADSELDNLRKQLNEAEAELNRAKTSMDSGIPIDTSTELQNLENLRTKLEEIKNTIISKNKAFNDEGIIVGKVVGKEIRALDLLLNKINDITNAINTKTKSFQTKGNTVYESVKQIEKPKEATASQKESFNDLLAFQKKYYDAQKALANGVGTVREEELIRKAAEAEDLYNKKKQEVKLTQEQENQLLEKQAELERELAGVKTDKETTSAAIAAKAKKDGILNAIKQEIWKSYKSTGITTLEEVPEELASTKVAYDALIDKINDYKSKSVALSDDIINGLKEEARAIKAVMDAYAEKTKQQAKSDKKESSEKQKPAYKNSVMNSLQKKYFKYYSVATGEEFAISPSVISAAEKLKYTWEELNRLNKEIGNTKPTEEQEIAFNRLTDEFNQARKELDGIISSTRKLSEKSLGTFNLFDAEGKSEFDLTNIEDRKRALLEAVNTLSEGKAKIGDFDAAYKELSYTVKNADGKWVDMKASINAAGTAIEVVAGKTKSNTSAIGQFIDQLKNKFKSIAQYLISMAGYQEIIQQIRKGIQYVKEIDSALTELKKVTDETDETYEKFLDTASKAGSEIGSTIADFTDATADFARLGYSISEATELAKAASIYKNVGDGIDSVAQATESIISTMKAFGIEAEDSMGIVNRFNEVGNNFAISSTGIGEALQRSASALYESGNTIDESIALITAANSVVQNPEQVGTALKTLSLRLRGAKVELEEAGEDVDGMATSVSSLQEKLLALTHGKVDIMADDATFKNTTQILREMSIAWEDMTDIERAAALELMGGKRQANILASIIKNYDTVDEVIETSLNSQNSAYEENIKWMDSIEGRTTQFTNALQTMWQNALGSDTIKTIVSLGTELIKLLDTLGVMPSVLGAIGIGVYLKSLSGLKEELSSVNAESENLINIFGKKTKITEADTSANIENAVSEQASADSSKVEAGAEIVSANAKSTDTGATTANTIATRANIAATKALIIVKNIAKGILIGAAISLVTAGISKLISGIDNIGKEAKKTASEIISAYNDAQNTLKNNKNTIEEISKDYEKLSSGVDQFGNNISLTTDEYKRYNEIVNKIADIFPTMVSGYTEEGNAIIATKGNVEELTKAYEAQAKAARDAIILGADEVFKTTKTDVKNYEDQIKAYEAAMSMANGLTTKEARDKYGDTIRNQATQILEDIGFESYIGQWASGSQYKSYGLKQKWDSINQKYEDISTDKEKEEFAQRRNTLELQYNQILGQQAASLQKVNTVLQAYLGNNVTFASMSSDLQSAVSSIVSSLNPADFDYDDEKMYAFINSNIIQPIYENKENVQDAFVDLLNIDSTKISYEAYKELNDNLKEAIKDLPQESQDVINEFFNKYDKQYKIYAAHAKKILQKEFADNINTLSLSDLKIAGEMQVDDDKLLSWDQLLNKIKEVKKAVDTSSDGKAFSSYIDYIEQFSNAQSIANEIIYDNIELTKEQGDALQELIGSETEYAEAVDASNGYIIKNAKLVKDLIAKKRIEATQNAKTEKTQAQLKYYDLYKQIKKLSGANGELAVKNKNQINTLYAEMGAVQRTIAKYSLLEQKLLGAANAYEKFEEAQTSDSEKDYRDNAYDLLIALIEGLQTGEIGTDTFQVAFEGIVPKGTLDGINTVEEKVAAIANYITNSSLKDYFTFDFNDDGSINDITVTLDNVKKFIEDGLSGKNGLGTVFTGTDWKHFELSEDITSLDEFAKRMGVTNEVALAFLTTLDKYNGEWLNGDYTSVLDQLDLGTDGNIMRITQQISELNVGLANGKISAEEYAEKIGVLNSKLDTNTQEAKVQWEKYQDVSKGYEEAKKKVEDYSKQLEEADENADTSNIEKELADATAELDKYGSELLEYEFSELTIQVILDYVNEGIDNFEKEYAAIKDMVEQDEESGEFKIKTGIKWEDSPVSEEKVSEYVKLLNDKHTLEVTQGEGVKTTLDILTEINDALNTMTQILAKRYGIDIETDGAISSTQTLIDKLSEIKPKQVFVEILGSVSDTLKTWWGRLTGSNELNGTANDTPRNTSNSRQNVMFQGTAHASGNWGLGQNEKDALVGELGEETIVNPKTGKYYTVGTNGAELVDIPKGSIIFNHKQTEALFKNGHINSRGKAYAEGNAHVTIVPDFTTENNFSGAGSYWTDFAESLNNASNTVDNAADSISDAADEFKEVFDWFDVLLEEIENNISLMNAKLENAVGISAKKGIYSEIINTEQFKLQELYEGIKLYSDYANKLLAKVPDQYKEMAKNGAVAITDFLGEANQEVVDSINNYREWAKKITDLNQQLEETKKTIADTHVEIQNMLKDEYDNRISLITSVNDRIQGTIDLLDEEGKRSSAVMYEEMIKNSTKQLSELQSKRAEMQRALDEAVRSGDVARESTQWYEMVNAINDVDSEINDCRISLEGFQNSINQLHWDNFEKFIDAIDNVGNEISNLGDLIDEEDVVDEVGNWTDKGITALGLYAQEMERAKYRAEQYGKEIEYLNQEYAAGKYSVDEYNEKLQELKDGQWDSIKSYEAAKKSIIDLNKTRVEAIKDGIQKEIDAYSELIDKKKEELSLQKDAHDFSKQVAEQQKNIANIQKQLAAMAGDNSASAIARRKQLEAELDAAQEELDELYYNHSVEKQQEALDKSLENYQDDKQNEMDALDESLKNEEQIIADSYATITANTESVAQTLSDIASQYGITLSDSVMQPWLDGANAIGTYQEQLDTSMSSFTQQLEALKQMYADLQNQADSAGRSMVDAINGNKSKTEGATYTPPTPSQPSTPSKPSKPSAPSTGSSVTVKKSATRFSRDGGNGTIMQSWVPGSTFTVYQVSGSEVLIGRNGQYTGWVRLSDIEGYAKGAKKIQNNQLAMLDELGDELVLHAGKNGRLEYLTKGTSVVPADITSNLMKLGSLDPKDILERNRPSIGAPHVIDNSIELKMEFGSLVHVDTVSNDTLPYLQKMVRNEFDNCMKHVNQGLKKFVR